MQGLLQSGSQAEIAAELLKLICKAFWSATYMGIPDMLLQQDQFIGWMTCIHTLMDMPVPKVHHQPLHAFIALLTRLHVLMAVLSCPNEPSTFVDAFFQELFAIMETMATQLTHAAVTTHVSKTLQRLQLHTLSYSMSHNRLLLSRHLQQRSPHMTQPRSRFETSLRSCLTVSHDSVLSSSATLRLRFEINLHSCLAVSRVSVLNSGAGGATLRPDLRSAYILASLFHMSHS